MRTLKVRVWRGEESGAFQGFEVPRLESQTVLDVVTHIQRELDPTLAYRFACRVGMCGSCAMTVNGRARWTCRTHVAEVIRDDALEVAPLKNLPIIRDLVTDMREFVDKWARARKNLRGAQTTTHGVDKGQQMQEHAHSENGRADALRSPEVDLPTRAHVAYRSLGARNTGAALCLADPDVFIQISPLRAAASVARLSPAIAAVGEIFLGQRSLQLMCV